MLIVITGPDGSGKTTITNRIYKLFLNDGYKVKSITAGNLSQPASTKKIDKYFSREIKGLIVSIIRLLKSLHAKILSKLGYIVICDRWPSKIIGKIDGPRYYPGVKNILSRLEIFIYRFVPSPDLQVILCVQKDTAIHRNNMRHKANKETELEIIERYKEFDSMAIYAHQKLCFNNDQCLEESSINLYNEIKKF